MAMIRAHSPSNHWAPPSAHWTDNNPSYASHSRATDLESAIETLSEAVIDMRANERVPYCCNLVAQHERSVRRAALDLLQGPLSNALTPDSAHSLLRLLHNPDWGIRSSALAGLALHAQPGLMGESHAAYIAQLLSSDEWALKAVAIEALALLDADALLPVAPRLISTLPTLDYSLQAGTCKALAILPRSSLVAQTAIIQSLRPALAKILALQTAPLTPSAQALISPLHSSPISVLSLSSSSNSKQKAQHESGASSTHSMSEAGSNVPTPLMTPAVSDVMGTSWPPRLVL